MKHDAQEAARLKAQADADAIAATQKQVAAVVAAEVKQAG